MKTATVATHPIHQQFAIRSKRGRLICVLLSAAMNVAISPRLDIEWLSLFCFVPLLLLIPGSSRGRLFWYFWSAGFLFRLGNLYWIYFVIQHYSRVYPILVVGILLLLCFALALCWGIFGWGVGFLTSR